MLTISREARIKVGRHAWNVFPLEAFGFLLGKADEEVVHVALPCSKTRYWRLFDDRWVGIDEHIEEAWSVAKSFDLDVVGLYAATAISNLDTYPIPPLLTSTSMQVLMYYKTQCCHACSWISYRYHERWLMPRDDYRTPPGIRASDVFNQKRVMKVWRKVFGPIDYSNQSGTD